MRGCSLLHFDLYFVSCSINLQQEQTFLRNILSNNKHLWQLCKQCETAKPPLIKIRRHTNSLTIKKLPIFTKDLELHLIMYRASAPPSCCHSHFTSPWRVRQVSFIQYIHTEQESESERCTPKQMTCFYIFFYKKPFCLLRETTLKHGRDSQGEHDVL